VLWFGTADGVSRFDGQTWTTYTEEDGLADNSVYAIAVDADGTLWFGTADGVSRFDGQTWTTYTEEDGLASNWVYAILHRKGRPGPEQCQGHRRGQGRGALVRR